jgi:NADH-quinone oxidoreductase subunit J
MARALFMSIFLLMFIALFLLLLRQKKVVYQFLVYLGMMVLLGIVYLFLGSEFLMAFQIIVYAGAILVMFLFFLYLYPEEEFKIQDMKNSSLIKILMPSLLFVIILTLILFAFDVREYEPSVSVYSVRELAKLIYNQYPLTIFLLAFILTYPMIAIYLLMKGSEGDD